MAGAGIGLPPNDEPEQESTSPARPKRKDDYIRFRKAIKSDEKCGLVPV